MPAGFMGGSMRNLLITRPDIDVIKLKLQSTLTDQRYTHSVNVSETAVYLADKFDVNRYNALIAGLLHDCAKDIPDDIKLLSCKKYNIKIDKTMAQQPDLTHSFLGAKIAQKEYGINDGDILNAIRYHTTGRGKMSALEKIIYLADLIEPDRKPFKSLEKIRQLAYEDLDRAMLCSLRECMKYVKQRNFKLHELTNSAYEYIKEDAFDN